MFVVHPVERTVDQPGALLQRRQELSLVLVDDVHDLKEETASCQSASADDNYIINIFGCNSLFKI